MRIWTPETSPLGTRAAAHIQNTLFSIVFKTKYTHFPALWTSFNISSLILHSDRLIKAPLKSCTQPCSSIPLSSAADTMDHLGTARRPQHVRLDTPIKQPFNYSVLGLLLLPVLCCGPWRHDCTTPVRFHRASISKQEEEKKVRSH